jgi:threonine/homoserine efflux transporter RhtA
MIIAVLALGGAILGATALAGFLMLYNIRVTADAVNSAKAIFAADSGVNWALYTYYHPPLGAQPSLGNGSAVTVICYTSADAPTPCDQTGAVPSYAISKGSALNSRRAFWLNLESPTATPP